jgi:Protein of unknown function (DUF3363)
VAASKPPSAAPPQSDDLGQALDAIDPDGLSPLVPWRPALEQQLGKQVSGVMSPGGAVDWSLGRKRGLGI